MTTIRDRLNAWLFAPVPATGLGVARVLLGLLLLVCHLRLWPDASLWFGETGVAPLAILERGRSAWRFSFYDLCTSAEQVRAVHALGLLPLIAFTVGWRARTMAWLSLLVAVSVHHGNPWIQNGGDRVLRLMTLYLALAPCGAAVSLDAWLHCRWRKAHGFSGDVVALVPGLWRRLVQVQLVVIYSYTGIAKLTGETWRDGTALYYALSDENYSRAPALFDALLTTQLGQLMASAGTLVTTVWEVGFGLMVLWGPTRMLALGLGLIFHGGIFMSMSVGLFSFATSWGYLAFLRPDWVQALTAWWQARRQGR